LSRKRTVSPTRRIPVAARVASIVLAATLALPAASCAPALIDELPIIGAGTPRPGQPLTRRQADRELRRAQLWMLDTYRGFRNPEETAQESGEEFRRAPCDERTGADCFQGEYECAHCLWSEDRRELVALGEMYDSIARLVMHAPPGTSVYMLNWLAGQRVGLWVRQGQHERARVAAAECTAEFWWCEALRAFVAHRAGDVIAAETRFATALELMPPGRACMWQEVGMYADTMALSLGFDAYGRMLDSPQPTAQRPCPDQGDAAAFWTLADPLWSVPGNPRRTEHFARTVDAHIHHHFMERIEFSRAGAHLRDHHSPLLRHGWPVGYRWRRPPPPPLMPPSRVRRPLPPPDPFRNPAGMVLTYGRGQSFIVTLPLDDALRAAPELLAPRDDIAIESFELPAGHVRAMPLQTGFFRRDGSDILVVRSAVPRQDVPAPDAWQLVAWDGDRFSSAAVRTAGDTLTAWLHAPWRARIVSLEALHDNGAWRGRSGTRPPDGVAHVALSSVVLISDAEAPARDLDDALRRMLPTARLAAGTGAGSYWELYAAAPVGAAIDVTVRRTERPGLLSRIFGGGPPPELRVRWEEIIEPDDGVARRTFDLDLHTLQPGSYQLDLVLTLHDGTVLRSTAVFSVAAAQPLD
jgi:hypothetical protein